VVTDSSGNFAAEGLADGTYQVIAEVADTDVPAQSDTVKIANGAADKSPTLTFKASVGQISGKVAFNDMADPSGVAVTLTGTDTRGVLTDSAGAFSFTGLKAGAYAVTAEVAGTREGRISMAVTASASAMPLPDMVFTNLGTLSGNVKAGTTNAPNAAVNIPGTELFALTDANGDFTIRNVPTGMRTVQARLNAATATQTVAVVKGDNTPLAFTLATALTGVLEGSIGFSGTTIDTGITVSVAGTSYTTTAAANGDWRLTVPPGAWEVVADARNYPRKSLGVHFVAAGATTRLPNARMSMYRRLAFTETVTGAQIVGTRGVCEGDQVLAFVGLASGTQLTVIDTNLLNRRQVATGSANLPVISSKCKWVGFQMASNTFVHNVATGELRMLAGIASYLDFSTDESVFFYQVGNTFHRYNLTSGVDDSFTANLRVTVTRDRHLVAGAGSPSNFQLVTTTTLTSAFSTAFTAVAHGGAAYGLTDCTAIVPITCTLRTLGTTGTTISTYATGSVPQTTFFEPNNSSGEYYHFRTTGLASILVRTSSGVGINMPSDTQYIRYSPGGTRMAYVAPAASQALREEALPGTGSAAPAATSSATFYNQGNYVSETRFVTFDLGTPRRIDIKSGVAAIDTDVTTFANGPYAVSGAVATWGKQSTSKRMASLGDGNDLLVDVPATAFGGAGSTPAFAVATPNTYLAPKWGAVGSDINTMWVIDGTTSMVRKVTGGFFAGAFAGNVFGVIRQTTSESVFHIPAYDQQLPIIESGLTIGSFSTLTLQPTIGLTTFAGDVAGSNDLLINRLLPQP
jgi:Carboxypeptidase regulatory-like domain